MQPKRCRKRGCFWSDSTPRSFLYPSCHTKYMHRPAPEAAFSVRPWLRKPLRGSPRSNNSSRRQRGERDLESSLDELDVKRLDLALSASLPSSLRTTLAILETKSSTWHVCVTRLLLVWSMKLDPVFQWSRPSLQACGFTMFHSTFMAKTRTFLAHILVISRTA